MCSVSNGDVEGLEALELVCDEVSVGSGASSISGAVLETSGVSVAVPLGDSIAGVVVQDGEGRMVAAVGGAKEMVAVSGSGFRLTTLETLRIDGAMMLAILRMDGARSLGILLSWTGSMCGVLDESCDFVSASCIKASVLTLDIGESIDALSPLLEPAPDLSSTSRRCSSSLVCPDICATAGHDTTEIDGEAIDELAPHSTLGICSLWGLRWVM